MSTLSWYFIVMFGLRGVLGLVLGDNNGKDVCVCDAAAARRSPLGSLCRPELAALMDETRMMQMQMGMGAGPQAMGFDAQKAYKQVGMTFVVRPLSAHAGDSNVGCSADALPSR